MSGRFVIGGTGRSGTKWCATALRMCGVHCGHEQVFTTDHLDGRNTVDWATFDGDSSLAAVPWFGSLTGVRRVLVVRNPFACAASFLAAGPFLERSQPAGLLDYLDAYHPEVTGAPDDETAALTYWCEWNEQALAHADEVRRIEHLDAAGLVAACLVAPRWAPPFPLDPVGMTVAARPPADWDRVDGALIDRTIALAAKLGYPT